MANRKAQGTLLAVLWLGYVALAVVAWFAFAPTRPLGFRSGFPHMPRYGAMTWWFFLAIPLIGYTWGFFNDLKDDGVRNRHYDVIGRRDDRRPRR